eukprot:scaffold510_cov242-Pinguiococcus_pyrenoidosus.AAC.8
MNSTLGSWSGARVIAVSAFVAWHSCASCWIRTEEVALRRRSARLFELLVRRDGVGTKAEAFAVRATYRRVRLFERLQRAESPAGELFAPSRKRSLTMRCG